MANTEVVLGVLTEEIERLEKENHEMRVALEYTRGFLIHQGYSGNDPLVLGMVNDVLGGKDE